MRDIVRGGLRRQATLTTGISLPVANFHLAAHFFDVHAHFDLLQCNGDLIPNELVSSTLPEMTL